MVSRWGRLVVLAGVLALVGCVPSEGEERSGVPSVTETSVPVSSGAPDMSGAPSGGGSEGPSEDVSEPPEVEAPERPGAMEQESVEGAIAAAKYFMELYPYIYATGDLTEWDALRSDACEFCGSVRDEVAELHASGGYSIGGEVDIYSSDGGGPYDDELADDVYVVELGVRIAETTDHLADGSTETYPAEDHPRFRIALTYGSVGWSVLDAWRDEGS